MEEVHMNSSELTPQSNLQVVKSESANLQQICRRGDKIYKVSDENITMIMEEKPNNINNNNNINIEFETKPSIASITKVDEVSSGESLYKTFSFDNTITKEETEKCISFWRSVVEKNLEPLKCSIIENLNNEKTKEDVPEKKDHAKNKKKEVKKEKKAAAKQAEERLKRRKQAEGSVWFKILEELQKRRLTQTKLLLEKRCRFCQNIATYETEDVQKELKNHLEELDKWEPQSGSKMSKLASTSASASLIKDAKRKSLRKSVDDNNSLRDNLPPTVDEEEPLDTETRQNNASLVEQVKEASRKYKHVDAIELKKQNRIYSKWRDNTVKKVCGCSHPKCGCNTNPAVTAVLNTPQESDGVCFIKMNKSKPDTADKNKNAREASDNFNQTENLVTIKGSKPKQDIDSQKIKTVISNDKTSEAYKKESSTSKGGSVDSSMNEMFAQTEPTRSRKSILKLKPYQVRLPEKIPSEKSLAEGKKYLSMLIKCICGDEDCDCHNTIEYQKPKSTDDVEIPKPPSVARRSVARVDSLEIIKRRTSEWGAVGKSRSFSKTDKVFRSSIDKSARKSVLTFKTDEDAISRERSSPRGSLKSGNRTLSIMLQCTCGKSDCDCTNTIQYIRKSDSEVLDTEPPKAPKLRKSVSRVDSLTIIKRRASDWGSKKW